MRVIIEVENREELEEILALLGDRPVTVVDSTGASPSRRAALLRELSRKYHIKLPEDWKFDRDEAHER